MTAKSEPLEADIMTAIRVALAAAGVAVFRHHVDDRAMRACAACGYAPEQRGGRTGLGIGVSDLICVVPPHGRFLGIEVKRPSTRNNTSPAQKAWLAFVRKHGGITGVATSVAEALELVREAREG